MQHKKGTHPVRNTILVMLLLLIIGGLAYGMSRYRSLKNSVNSSFKASGLTKERNVTNQLSSKKPISILLLGTDTGSFGRSDRGRTDSMMVVTINPKINKTTVTSVPRDTAVSIPGYTSDSPSKINAAYAWGGTKTTIKTVQKMLNIPIDFYALVNLGGLKKVVNKVGGVDVTPTLSFSNLGYTFKKGIKTHMNGKKALAYVDMRYKDPQGDYGRQTRQRSVLMAIVHKTGSVSALLNQEFIDSISSETQTDLTFDDLTMIAKDYRTATKNVKQTHLQGTGKELNDQSMEVMKKSELQRVTNFIRNGLSLSYKKTGSIAVFSSTNSKSKSRSSSSSSTGTNATTANSGTNNSDYGYGY
ncbi:LCP family protein [Levilactobacillus brevis]|uniref:LCP family protein n=2 Tax=Levilactobacillus brevis TaxID=1580 RepID=UPI00063AE772|nr:LCP family protein [Levilactobacillus brevis]KLE30381.1 LytR family transcriptional regulator [Levilactobacillus brevis]MBX6947938.1 LCP family protein [Levilactobacillus brevis]MCT3577603.1 LytR family transcriptional regulator [Levilactobacillus brevis]MDM5046819.1 LCP family protein [Levilactobacillus brevis]PTV22003.1 LytR family transcriptional regulator [Levilactobacillus brevis]